MTARIGRPKSNNPKNVRIEIRIDQSTADKLQNCADRLDTTRTDIIVKGIDLVQAKINQKE